MPAEGQEEGLAVRQRPLAAPRLVQLHLTYAGDSISAVLVLLEAVPLEGGSACSSVSTTDIGAVATLEDAAAARASDGVGAGHAQQQDEHSKLLHQNYRLQCLVRQYVDSISKASRKSMQEAGGLLMEGADQRYLLAMQQLQKLMAQKAEVQAAASRLLAVEQERLAAVRAQAQGQQQAFLQLVADVAAASARAAAAGLVRAAPSEHAVQSFLADEPRLAAEGLELRLANARLCHQLAAAEQRLKDSEQAAGLHLVDFEQLRIENASLAAKREARGAEVDKLRVKLVQAVQIAAHVQEKLHCAELVRGALATSLYATEAQLQSARAQVAAGKVQRDKLNKKRDELSEDWRIVSDTRCLEDMQRQQAELEQLQGQVAALQAQYVALGGR